MNTINNLACLPSPALTTDSDQKLEIIEDLFSLQELLELAVEQNLDEDGKPENNRIQLLLKAYLTQSESFVVIS